MRQVRSRKIVQELLARDGEASAGGRIDVLRATGANRKAGAGNVTQHERFARALSSIARRVSRMRSVEVCCGGLTPEQFETLRALEASTDPSMGRLSTALGVDLSTMSRNVSVLQREGYVERTRHPDDSRVVTVTLTRKGANALETLRCDEKDVMAKLYSRIPATSRAAALQALEVVRTALEPDAEASGSCCADDQPKKAAR
jgi:DNA-binding MarR family transcriptional regulator